MYQPKTGAKCLCKRGVQRDNCSNCEGTGWVIDFRAIRESKQGKGATSMFDVTGAIIDYESGMLNEEGVIELFQHLVDTGMAWQLQGSYGRTAQSLIEAGLIAPAKRGGE